MDILFLNHNVIWRSTFFRCLQFGKQLVANGHRVDLLTIAPRERWTFRERDIDGVRVIETPDLLVGMTRTGWDPYDTFRRSQFLKHRHYDLIHAFDCRARVAVARNACFVVGDGRAGARIPGTVPAAILYRAVGSARARTTARPRGDRIAATEED
jgi:hypothetical protein